MSHLKLKKNFSIVFFIFSILIVPSQVFSKKPTALSTEYGGGGGVPFVEMVAPNSTIYGIIIKSGRFIDSIQLVYRYKQQNILSKLYGGSGGLVKSFYLSKGEYITELGGRSGKYVDSIYIKTNRGRTEHWGGNGGSKKFKFTGTRKMPIRGIWGRSGALIDAIGVIKDVKSNSNTAVRRNSLSSFRPNRGKRVIIGGGKADSFTNPDFPINDILEFLQIQNSRLYSIIQNLSPSEVDSYINETEFRHCHRDIWCEVDTRVDLIRNTMGTK